MDIPTLIIDDEPGARAEMRWLLSLHPGHPVVGEAETFADARELLARPGYRLVLLDIQLVGGNGFDLVPEILPEARIIFVTAFDEHALRAFEVNALDYLLKPVARDRFATALARISAGPTVTATGPRPAALALDDRLLLRLDSTRTRFVRLDDILIVTACENYTEVRLVSGEKLFVRMTMKKWEERLPSASFARAHRHLIVNLAHLERIERRSRATHDLHLAGLAEPLAASYRYIANLRRDRPATGK